MTVTTSRATRIWHCAKHNKYFARPLYYDRHDPESERFHNIGNRERCGPLVPMLAIPDKADNEVETSIVSVVSDIVASHTGLPRGEYLVVGCSTVFSLAYRKDHLSRWGPPAYRDEKMFDRTIALLTPPTKEN